MSMSSLNTEAISSHPGRVAGKKVRAPKRAAISRRVARNFSGLTSRPSLYRVGKVIS